MSLDNSWPRLRPDYGEAMSVDRPPPLPEGLVAVVKRDCPTCVLVAPVLEDLAERGDLTVISQDDPGFPTTADWVLHDSDLSLSWHHEIETVPTLLRVVDGAPAEVQGTLTYEESISALPYLGVALIVAGLIVFWGRDRGLRVPAALLALVSLAGVVVGRADFQATPDGAGNPLLWALPVVALAAAVGATVLARRSAGVVMALASVASLSGWALLRFQALVKPVLPTDLPFAVDRTTLALALGVSIAAAYLTVTSGVLALPDLDED